MMIEMGMEMKVSDSTLDCIPSLFSLLVSFRLLTMRGRVQ